MTSCRDFSDASVRSSDGIGSSSSCRECAEIVQKTSRGVLLRISIAWMIDEVESTRVRLSRRILLASNRVHVKFRVRCVILSHWIWSLPVIKFVTLTLSKRGQVSGKINIMNIPSESVFKRVNRTDLSKGAVPSKHV